MFEEIVGTSAPLKNVLSRISKVAPTDSTVLITGETGTGKELVARAIHRRSPRVCARFCERELCRDPPSLIASELFGHERGAFTGALAAPPSVASSWRKEARSSSTKSANFRGDPDRAVAGSSGARIRARRRQPADSRGRAGDRRHESRPGSRSRGGPFRADLFYRLNVFPVTAASAGTSGGHSAAGRALHPSLREGASGRRSASVTQETSLDCSGPTTGPGTSANCRTSSSGPSSSAIPRRSRSMRGGLAQAQRRGAISRV